MGEKGSVLDFSVSRIMAVAALKPLMVKKQYKVVPDSKGGWNVLQEGNAVALFQFGEKELAIEKAREICKCEGSDLFVHCANGTHRVLESFSGD